MRAIFTLLFMLLFLPFCSFGQEDPYYELPKNRNKRIDAMAMPNLDAKVIKWYISASGGLKPNDSYLENDLEQLLEKRKLINTFWDINFGQNRNYDLYFETGVMQNPVFTSVLFGQRLSRSGPIGLKNGKNYLSIPLRVKKRVMVLDKITKMAFWNVGAAVVISPGMTGKTLRSSSTNLLRISNGVVVDTVVFNYNSQQMNVPVNFEVMTEISGKIVEKVEISLFVKAMIYPKSVLRSDFELVYDPSTKMSAIQKTNNIMLQFGLNLKLNYPAVIRYESRL